MFKNAPAVMLVAVMCLLAGCSGPDTKESVGLEMLDAMEDFAKVLSDVKDVDSAKAAEPRLEKIAARMSDINERRKALGELTEAEQNAFMEQYSDRMDAAGEAVFKEIERIGNLDPAVNEELDRIMAGLQGDFMFSN